MARNKAHKSVKHDIIDKDNSRILTAVAVSVFLVVFCSFAMRTLFSQSLYHSRVISEKTDTLRQLEDNLTAIGELEDSYRAFVDAPENVLTGDPDGDGPLDGDNGRITLDALPGEYDYPALATSFEKILIDAGYDVKSIGGSEDLSAENTATADAKPIPIPFTFSFTSSLQGTEALFETLERSIRPMNLVSLGISVGKEGKLSTNVKLDTYYTQQKAYELGSKVIE